MKKLTFYAAVAVGIFWLMFLAVISVNAHAQDQDSRWVRQVIKQRYLAYDHWTGSYVYRYRPVEKWVRIDREPTRVYSYIQRDRDYERSDGHGERCKTIRRVVGQQALTMDGAKKEANDAWAGAIRFHHGEKYLDLSNARQITYTCSRSSIKEGSVTTLGQTFTRCEVEAIPCRPRPQREEGQ